MRGSGEVAACAVDKVEAVDKAVAGFGVVGKDALGLCGGTAQAGAVAAGWHELDGVHGVVYSEVIKRLGEYVIR